MPIPSANSQTGSLVSATRWKVSRVRAVLLLYFTFILRAFEHRVGSAPWVLRFPRSSRNCRSDQPEIMTPSLLSGPGPGFLCVYILSKPCGVKPAGGGKWLFVGFLHVSVRLTIPRGCYKPHRIPPTPAKSTCVWQTPRPSHACDLREDRFPQGGEWSLVSTHLIVLLSM